MAFQQGLSGLNTSSKAIDVVSNNIANASTVGFKSAAAHFADVYAASLSGGGAQQIGIGTTLAAVQQEFTQGNITTTNNPLDISINGNGFYRLDQNGAISYSRNGQFHLDKSGYIINDQSLKLTGYAADTNGVIVPSTPTAIQVSAANLSPVATGASVGSGFQGVRAEVNLDSRAAQPTSAWSNGPAPNPVTGVAAQWTPDPSTYNYSTALAVYDTLGNPHTLTYYFAKTPVSGQWNVYANVDGTSNQRMLDGAGNPIAGPVAQLQFDAYGQLTAASAATNVNINLNGVLADVGKPNNAVSPLSFKVDFTGSTQYAGSFDNNKLEQDGYSSGRLTGLTVGSDGVVQGRYSNGQTRAQGQIVLANFTNANGLQSIGNNQWVETSVSGVPTVGAPNTSSLGVLQSASVEESNVDLTAQLVTMITQQRNYQASAQSIKTQDQIMQTLVNLR
ncbi:MAG: flgE [Rhodocyclaceae bacterium]|nr:flgE [Rhodocyclaceae bacterium]